MNRVWQYHFGRGLCDTPSDFGRMGGAPSHPELLDWLAVWFRDEARGSLKQLHRLIVTSRTYRQRSLVTDDAATNHALAVDSDNRLLWRQNRLRLDADGFRDFTMVAAGTLDLKMGGPAIQIFIKAKGRSRRRIWITSRTTGPLPARTAAASTATSGAGFRIH